MLQYKEKNMTLEVLFYAILALILATTAIAAASFAPWVPTRKHDLERILRLAGLKAGEKFYDLGCGTGGVVFYIGRHSPARAVGLELAWPIYLIAKVRQFLTPKSKVKIKFKSFFLENLSQADAVYLFAASSGHIKDKLKAKLKRELKPGARVISYAFPISGWQAVLRDKPSENVISLYLYKI